MQIRWCMGGGLALLTLTLAAAVGGCGGSTTKATPVPGAAPVVTSTTLTPTTLTPMTPTSTTGAPAGATTSSTSKGAGTGGSQTSAGQLAAVTSELDQAGTALRDGNAAVGASDVNQAKSQEGSAP